MARVPIQVVEFAAGSNKDRLSSTRAAASSKVA